MDTTLQGIDPYAVLGVNKDATEDEIKKAYRDLSQTLHPDHGGSEAEFATLSLSYKILMDPDDRAYYDRTGHTKDRMDIDKDAMELILGYFKAAMDQMGESVFHHDLIGGVKECLQKAQAKGQGDIQRFQKDIRRFKEIKKRLERKDDSLRPFLEMELDKEVVCCQAGIEESKEALQILEHAKKIASSYVFQSDQSHDMMIADQLKHMYGARGYNPVTVVRGADFVSPTS